ncbi:MAG: DUF4286 family protein [Muribaculaceae bacterium]|nr:DUF4286 family protein [Bacteroides sp.]MDE7473720.1 DUF4286 family protein [Muribaculaceae bacterium]
MSFIRNTTFIVERGAIIQFAEWARHVFIEAARSSGRFHDITMARILTEVDPNAVSFAIQMKAPTLAVHDEWHRDVATLLKDDIAARLGAERVLFFTTDMEVID